MAEDTTIQSTNGGFAKLASVTAWTNREMGDRNLSKKLRDETLLQYWRERDDGRDEHCNGTIGIE